MGRKQRSASVDRWSELSEDESLLTSRASTIGSSSSGGTLGGSSGGALIVSMTTATVTGNYASHAPSPGSSNYANRAKSPAPGHYANRVKSPGHYVNHATSLGSGLEVPTYTTPSTPSTLSPNHALYATVPRAARCTTPKQQQQQQYLMVPSPQQHQASRTRSSCDTLKEISNMKLPGSGGVYGRAGALRLILSSTTSESEDSKACTAKKSVAAKKSNSNKSLSSSMKNINQISVNNNNNGNSKEEDGGKNGGGGGARLVRRASASFRNWLSGSDRSDDDDTRESGWYSDYDLTSYRRHAVHPNNAGSRAANNAAFIAGIAAASASGGGSASKAYSNSGAGMGGRGSTLSRTFKSLLSPNPKTTSVRRSKSPRVPAACGAAAAAAAAAAGGGIASSSSEDLAF